MTLTALTCTGDRPEAFALCERWMSRQTLKPDQWIVCDDGVVPTTTTAGQTYLYRPELAGKLSMIRKVALVLEKRLVTSDALLFIEDDDWFSPRYLQVISAWLEGHDLVGESRAIYYNVLARWWFDNKNTGHCSLCTTGIRRALYPMLLRLCRESRDVYVDVRLWSEELPQRHFKRILDPGADGKRLVIGIKSMPGRRGYGVGHDPTGTNCTRDPDLFKLRSLIGEDAESYAKFYQP